MQASFSDYYIIESLLIMFSIKGLKIEEEVLSEEFSFVYVCQSREKSYHLVLTRMKKEAELL